MLALSFFAYSQPLEAFLEEHFIEDLLVAVGSSVCDLVDEADIHGSDLGFSLGVVHLAVHPCILAWRVCVLLEVALDPGGTLIDAAARGDMCFHDLVVVFYWGCLADDDLLAAFDQSQSGVEASNIGLHFVFDAASAIVLEGLVLHKLTLTI